MEYYEKERQAALDEFGVRTETGLTAAQVKENETKYGKNQLTEKKKKTLFQRYLAQFKDIMVIILIIAAAISFFIAFNGEEKTEYLESMIIVAIVILNATLGVVQENKAEKALEALKKLSQTKSKVLRDGFVQILDSWEIVPGDIVLLEAGDFIPADGRLIESASLRCDESALTGESLPKEKDAALILNGTMPLGDRDNMVFSGCPVVYGRGKALITATGMNTEIGKIAGLLAGEEDGQTPLQYKLAKIGKVFGFSAIGISAIIFVLGLVYHLPPLQIFMTAVSLAVAAIPEGLVAIVAVILSMGVTRMVKENAIVKRLPAVETLGSASVICSDKTGTLTQNRMTLVEVWAGNAPEPADNIQGELERTTLFFGALACDGDVQIIDGAEKHIGDPTETAIVAAAIKNNMDKRALNEAYPRLGEVPFDSDRKLMTTIHNIEGKYTVIVKGAFDVLMSRCHISHKEEAAAANHQMGEKALRVLGVAYKHIDEVPENPTADDLECGLTFMGLLGMIDPPREEAKEAVAICLQAGIRPVMITGDHVVTARAIAQTIGIFKEGDEAISGQELAAMSDEDFQKNLKKYSVYARVSPEDKIRIVKAWQKEGDIVAMTGDGVNDAPALKAADIGCAMGITGTEVAKNAADMILTDDNFATIVHAVREGRGIFDNIKKVIEFLLGTNIGEVLTVLTAMLLWQHPPLLALQILWINLVTDALPAFALGFEPINNDVMHRKPRPKSESFFANGLGIKIILQGVMFATLTLAGFSIGYTTMGEVSAAQTMAFLVLALSQVFHAYNVRSTRSIFKTGIGGNPFMYFATLVSIALIAFIAFIPPLANIFGMEILNAQLYAIALGLAFLPILFVEIGKRILSAIYGDQI